MKFPSNLNCDGKTLVKRGPGTCCATDANLDKSFTYIDYQVWNEITYPFVNFNIATIKIHKNG